MKYLYYHIFLEAEDVEDYKLLSGSYLDRLENNIMEKEWEIGEKKNVLSGNKLKREEELRYIPTCNMRQNRISNILWPGYRNINIRVWVYCRIYEDNIGVLEFVHKYKYQQIKSFLKI